MSRKEKTNSAEENLEVRFVQGAGWEVLLEATHQWHSCRNEQDARFISNGMHISAAAMRGQHAGEETAQELEQAEATLYRNVGPSAAGAILRASLRQCRGEPAGDL